MIDWLIQNHQQVCSEQSTNLHVDNEANSMELTCTQEAGDVVYVPRLWGHAVLNLQLSVGAAVEFEQQ